MKEVEGVTRVYQFPTPQTAATSPVTRRTTNSSHTRNRYETVLTRRAIRKHTNGVQQPPSPPTTAATEHQRRKRSSSSSSSSEEDEDDDDDPPSSSPLPPSGDVSLGLKMVIINQKVIIQYVKPSLIDGSPSPAAAVTNPQEAIQRGDVILSINGISPAPHQLTSESTTEDIVAYNNVLLEWVQLLNQYNAATGYYDKTIRLELARGAGLRLIELWDASQDKLAEKSILASSSNSIGIGSSGNSRRGFFGRRHSSSTHSVDDAPAEGYMTLQSGEGDDSIVVAPPHHTTRRVAGAAAVAGMAGLVLMGPLTAVAAAGGAAYVVHQRRKNSGQNKRDGRQSMDIK